MSIHITNKLEVIRNSTVIQIPGCEPESSITSTTLSMNRDCPASVISLEGALAAVPGSYVEIHTNPIRKFFVLPEGPPIAFGCAGACDVTDWYTILKEAAREEITQETISSDSQTGLGGCDSFELRLCP